MKKLCAGFLLTAVFLSGVMPISQAEAAATTKKLKVYYNEGMNYSFAVTPNWAVPNTRTTSEYKQKVPDFKLMFFNKATPKYEDNMLFLYHYSPTEQTHVQLNTILSSGSSSAEKEGQVRQYVSDYFKQFLTKSYFLDGQLFSSLSPEQVTTIFNDEVKEHTIQGVTLDTKKQAVLVESYIVSHSNETAVLYDYFYVTPQGTAHFNLFSFYETDVILEKVTKDFDVLTNTVNSGDITVKRPPSLTTNTPVSEETKKEADSEGTATEKKSSAAKQASEETPASSNSEKTNPMSYLALALLFVGVGAYFYFKKRPPTKK